MIRSYFTWLRTGPGNFSRACRLFSTSGKSNNKDTDGLQVYSLEGTHKGITVFGFNRPHVRNAIDFPMLHQLLEAFASIRQETTTRAVILRSLHSGMFCSGADLKERIQLKEPDYRRWSLTIRAMTAELANLPVPVIAAIDGYALGGGLEIALACDVRIAGSNVKVGLPETSLAIIPGAGGTQRLCRLVGPARAKELMFTARVISAEEAMRLGVVNHVVDQNEAGDAAYQSALNMATTIAENGPVAIQMAKYAINKGLEVDINTGLAFEQGCYGLVIPSKDRIEGLTAFKEKRPPKYTGEWQ